MLLFLLFRKDPEIQTIKHLVIYNSSYSDFGTVENKITTIHGEYPFFNQVRQRQHYDFIYI